MENHEFIRDLLFCTNMHPLQNLLFVLCGHNVSNKSMNFIEWLNKQPCKPDRILSLIVIALCITNNTEDDHKIINYFELLGFNIPDNIPNLNRINIIVNLELENLPIIDESFITSFYKMTGITYEDACNAKILPSVQEIIDKINHQNTLELLRTMRC